MNKKTIWIISQDACFLENRPLSLSRVFAERGYNPVVITTSYHHNNKTYLYDEPIKFVERSKGCNYVYIKTSPAYKTHAAQRAFNLFDFGRKYRKYCNLIAEKTGKPDFIVASLDNPFIPIFSHKSAKNFHAKFITEIRDIWPFSLTDVLKLSEYHPFVLLVKFLEKYAFKHSDAIISSFPFGYKYIEQVSGVNPDKVLWIPNGIDTREVDRVLESDAKLPEDLDEFLSNHWCAVYTGSIVKNECIDYIINAWEYLRDTDICLAIVGDGTESENLQKFIDSKNLQNVKMFPAVPPSMVCKVIQKAHCCCLRISPDRLRDKSHFFGWSINKLNDYLYSGKPVIFSNDYPSVVEDAGHFAIPMCDDKTFAETVKKVRNLSESELHALSERGKNIIRSEYDYHVIGEKYIKMLEGL